MKTAVEHIFNGPTGLITSYDSSKTMLGSLMQQYSGVCGVCNYVSTKKPNYVNVQYNYSFYGGITYDFGNIDVHKWSDDKYWIFLFPRRSPSTYSYIYRVFLLEFDTSTSNFSLIGNVNLNVAAINFNPPTYSKNNAIVINYTKGSISGSGIGITGSGVSFISDQITYGNRSTGTGGARLGIGATFPSGITQWYEISGVCTENYLILKTSLSQPVTTNTPYIIEEIRLLLNEGGGAAGATGNSWFLSKGINYNNFVNNNNMPPAQSLLRNNEAGGRYITSLSAITSSATANGTAGPFEHSILDDEISYTERYGYALPYRDNSTGFPNVLRIAKYNAYQGLTGSLGNIMGSFSGTNGSTGGFQDFVTEPLIQLTSSFGIFPNDAFSNFGFVSFSPNIRCCDCIGTPQHGSAKGKKSIFMCLNPSAGGGRILRYDLDSVFNKSDTVTGDYLLEIPPGGSNIAYSPVRAYWSIAYDKSIDRIIASTQASGFRCYTIKYDASGIQQEKLFGADLNLFKGYTAWADDYRSLFITNINAAPQFVCKDGWMFTLGTSPSTFADYNVLQAVPIGADGYYASSTNQRIITPKLFLENPLKLYRVYVNTQSRIGQAPDNFPSESYTVYYRTSGIDNNSGSWTEVPISGDLTNVSPSEYIQFMFELDVLGETCIPARINSVAVVYETDNTQDSHYEPSSEKSSSSNREFAWKQVSSWGSNIPNLRIRMYNSSTKSKILDDTVLGSTYGIFEYSTNGTTWNSWNSTADSIGNYIRYTATELPGGINIRVLLTQA
jgi:hypothetical protein